MLILLKSLICSGLVKSHHLRLLNVLSVIQVKMNFTLIVKEDFIDVDILIVIACSLVHPIYSSEVMYQEVY